MRWRHVRFELADDDVNIDFTWEREWRIRISELKFGPEDATIVVPDESWSRQLRAEHYANQRWQIELYSTAIDPELTEQIFNDPFSWRVVSLAD